MAQNLKATKGYTASPIPSLQATNITSFLVIFTKLVYAYTRRYVHMFSFSQHPFVFYINVNVYTYTHIHNI